MHRKTFISVCCSLSFCSGSVLAYQSTYDNIQWEPRGSDTRYCLDLTDENGNIYPGFKEIACGEDLYSFSPRAYVRDEFKLNPDDPRFKGITFGWRVRSQSGEGGRGFEGLVTVGSDCGLPSRSDSEMVQWGCHLNDTFYCLDLFDAKGQAIKAPLVCGENMHSFSPRLLKETNLPAGIYRWKVWSHSAYDYSGHQASFEGQFQHEPSDNDGNGSANWEHEGESGSADWTDNDGNGSANWEHEGESGSADGTDNDGNGSTQWSHGDESGEANWTTDNDGNGSTQWSHGDENGSANWTTDDDCNGSVSWNYGGGSGSVNWSSWTKNDKCQSSTSKP